MPNPDNEPQLPKNQSPIIDDRTGLVSRDWYRFFLNLLNKANTGGGGSGTVTSVNVSGGTTGLTTSGGPITTSGTITLAGTLDVDNGGTGATTAPSARTNLGAAASGANSDITSMTGITGGISTPDFIQFDTAATVTSAVGKLFYDSGDGSLTLGLKGGNVDLQVGQENVALVYNNSASTITNGQVVAVNGAQGQRPAVVLADADSEPLSAATLGIATENIAAGAEGFICTFGLIRGIDTSAFTAGDPVYLSQTAGAFTATHPTAPAHTVFLGWIIKVNASSGELFLNINNGWELDELHNVLITSPTSGNTLIYDAVAGVWKNASLTAGTAISVTNGAGSITIANTGVTSAVAGTGISVSGATGAVTITNTAPDQTVSLTGGTGISTSGTYPSFTITNTLPMTYPGAGIPNSTGTAWGTSYSTTGSGTVVALATSPSFTTPILGTPQSGNFSTGTFTWPTFNQNTTGTASNVTGVVAIANGGTGQTTASAAFNALSPVTTTGDLIIGNGANSSTRLPIGANNYVLTSNGTTAVWAVASGSGATITNDTSTSTNVYPTFAAATSGALSTIYTSNAKLLYKPSTGELTSTAVVASNGIFVNNLTISTSYTIAAGTSGMSAGPITVASGVSVTVASGSRWVVA